MARIHRRTTQKKDYHDPDNHNGVITHLEPDILECEVKWILGKIKNIPQYSSLDTWEDSDVETSQKERFVDMVKG